jgi:hypothetical protein
LERTPGLAQLKEEHGQELLELVHGTTRTEKMDVTNGNHKEQRKWKGERAEKEEQLTTRTGACSGKPEKDQSCRISPVTVEEEEDVVVAVVGLGSIT